MWYVQQSPILEHYWDSEGFSATSEGGEHQLSDDAKSLSQYRESDVAENQIDESEIERLAALARDVQLTVDEAADRHDDTAW